VSKRRATLNRCLGPPCWGPLRWGRNSCRMGSERKPNPRVSQTNDEIILPIKRSSRHPGRRFCCRWGCSRWGRSYWWRPRFRRGSPFGQARRKLVRQPRWRCTGKVWLFGCCGRSTFKRSSVARRAGGEDEFLANEGINRRRYCPRQSDASSFDSTR
jgi:hypothetical protein